MTHVKVHLNVIEKLFMSLLYGLLLVFLYEYSVYPSFGYMGFTFYGVNWLLVSIQLVLIAIVSFVMPMDFQKPSDLCAWILFKLVFIPSMLIPSLVVKDIGTVQLLFTNFVFFLCMLSIVSMSLLPVKVNAVTVSPFLFWLTCLAISGLFMGAIAYDFGLSLSRLFDLRNYSEIYDIRYAHREAKENSSVLSNYGLLWLAKVLVPLFWGWGLYKKSTIIIVVTFTAQVALFAVSAHKSFLFTLVFIYFVYWLTTKTDSGIWFQRCIVGFTGLSVILFYFLDFDLLVSIIVRRVFIVPGMLSGFFLEFYSNNPYALYSHNFLGGMFDTNYTSSPAFTVGKAYFGRDETSANVNFWGDSFANFGYVGILLITLILNVTLLIINACSFGKNKMACLSLFAISFWTITETSLTTTFISHGLALAIMLCFLMPNLSENSHNTS